MKAKIIIVFLAITLAACAPTQPNTTDIQNTAVAIVQTGVALTQTALPTDTLPPPTFTSTALPTSTPEATATPTEPIVPLLTPDAIQVERWKEYETALAKNLLSFLPPEIVLCEWEILGRSGQDLYVWAMCEGAGSTADMPAVIHLEANGTVQSVTTTLNSSKPYVEAIRTLFPPNIQEILFGNSIKERLKKLSIHLDSRRENPTPPLIIIEAMPSQ